MSENESHHLTFLLQQVGGGDKDAVEKLISIAYPELRRIAANRLRSERVGHTLQPTALVNEVYLRLFGSEPIAWQNRAHFFAVVAKQMRFILVDHARRKNKDGAFALTLEGHEGEDLWRLAVQTDEEMIALDDALQRFGTIDPRAAQGVELRFFGGLTLKEVAEVQDVDVATVKRDWVFARSWLFRQLAS
ncbi:MAG TPA: sigma-70 family RNA polymerase sigma factor [Blastocatellia bacterium]|nr:sigma-70 family RNA polymerase sigma factor [Blastocatellia bacterium]